jgi:outer membrane protein TolC
MKNRDGVVPSGGRAPREPRRRTRILFAAMATVALASSVLPAFAQSNEKLPAKATIPTAVSSPVLPAVPTVAPGYKAPEVAPTSAEIIGVTQQPFVGITLQDAVAMALLKNPNLAISASNTKIARYQIVQAKGPFDLNFHVQPSSSYSVQPPENLFFAGPGTQTVVSKSTGQTINNPGNIIQHQSSFSYGLNGQAVNGTTYSAGIQQSRTYNNTVFNAYEPSYLADLNLSVTQPLLKNLGMNAAKRQLKLSFVNADASSRESLVDASNTIAQVEDAYWNLVAAWRNVAIQDEALKEAIAQQESNTRLAKRGAAAPIAVVESSTQVSNFQNNVFSALQTVAELQTQLKAIVVADPSDPIWRANLIPTSPVLQLPTVGDLDQIISAGLKNRPEVQQAADKRQQADIDRAYAKNQALPQADAQVTYESNGFAGLPTATPPFFKSVSGVCQPNANLVLVCPQVPPQTRGTMAYAYHNMWTALFPTFNIGLTVGYPLQNDLAKGLKGAAAEEERQAAIQSESVTSDIGSEARNALQAYQSALSRLNASRNAREAAEQVYASELRKFHNGASTTYLVLQRQVQLAGARGEELKAQTDLNEAIVELQRVDGTILSANGVHLNALGSQAVAP